MADANSIRKPLNVAEPDSALRNWPADDRPTVKLLNRGTAALSDAELLAVLLRTGSKSASSVDLARALVAEKGSLSKILASSEAVLSGIDVEPEQQARLAAVVELARRALRETIDCGSVLASPQSVRDYLRLRFQGREHEVFAAVFLNAQNRVIEVEDLFHGTLTQTSVFPREIVKRALFHNAGAIIFAHNHPSGVAEPSRADEALTQTLKQTLALVDVKVLDHFVIGADSAMSFAERGLL
jgi:DNA repair protein RadC